MAGHGHVTPNPDGSKARCGGPGVCPECSREKIAHDAPQLLADKPSGRVRIESDGAGYGTRVFDASGNDITASVAEVTWTVKAGGMAEATLTLLNVEIAADADGRYAEMGQPRMQYRRPADSQEAA